MTFRPTSRFDLPRSRKTPADEIARHTDAKERRDIARRPHSARVWL